MPGHINMKIICPQTPPGDKIKVGARSRLLNLRERMSHFRLRAGPCRPGITGATRPGSDILCDIPFLTPNKLRLNDANHFECMASALTYNSGGADAK